MGKRWSTDLARFSLPKRVRVRSSWDDDATVASKPSRRGSIESFESVGSCGSIMSITFSVGSNLAVEIVRKEAFNLLAQGPCEAESANESESHGNPQGESYIQKMRRLKTMKRSMSPVATAKRESAPLKTPILDFAKGALQLSKTL